MKKLTTREHTLKTRAEYWDALASGEKTFEVRRDDRGFQKGDILVLRRMRESDPSLYDYENKTLRCQITFILTGGQLGIEPGHVIMGLRHA
jgi:hypothetical protein